MHNIVSVLKNTAQKNATKKAILFLEDGIYETISLSYAALNQKAQSIAACLQAQQLGGSRVLLCYPTGIDFIAGLIGCWYAGVIAVPIHCPKVGEFESNQEMINSIANDASITAVLSTSLYCSDIEAIIENKVLVLATDKMNLKTAENYSFTDITDDTIAYLQYTSGSTSAPKAAIITHGNLQHSLKQTIKAWHYTSNSITLTWAPHTHVYGLVCGLLVPLYHGTLAIIMPPAAFINKPLVWLNAISKYRVSHSGCPNFGYDMCVSHIKDCDLSSINLKHWQVAINGGDMVQHHTLMAFANKFSTCGFELRTFCSAYGMSELSGAIAVTSFGVEPKLFSPPVGRSIISSGSLLKGLHAVVVDPKTEKPVAIGETGEVWLSGKSLVHGYWQKPDETNAVFNKQLPGSALTYFKTGDLGFILDNEIYLTGRLKEVIIVHGKKYYPLDLEMTVAQSLSGLLINVPQVVFSTDIAGQEAVIVVQEWSDESPLPTRCQVKDIIRHAMLKQQGVDIHDVIFVCAGSIPRTTSGKLQRKKCHALFIANQLDILTNNTTKESSPAQHANNKATMQFITLIADVLNKDAQEIDLKAPLSRYAFDSINIIHLTSKLNETFHLALSPAALYNYATLEAFYTDVLDKDTIPSQPDACSNSTKTSSDIAIIGMNGVFPQSPDMNTFWENLCMGKDCITEVPLSRWDWHDLTVKWGGFIDHVDHFDAAFFNISPREAELIDPQQRLFLQTVWKTIEDAGYTSTTLAPLKTGLFVGVFNHDYAELLQKNDIMDAYLTTGTLHSMIANRISYLLNLRGPSEAIDTACSSSLVAIHQAVHAILQGDCNIAIAGGVNTLITPTSFISADKAGMLSNDGRCKTFDKKANGYVRSEGVGAILLKSLSQALQDGDHIYGVIKGTAINHGGHVNTLTAPNPNAQADVIVSACHRANVPINTIQYIETHGTGTPLGDPIEINGLKKAFQQLALEQCLESLPNHYCGLGSVKTHIGHLESAAGIAGVIKILLAMRHNKIPANLHLDELNPYIDIKESPFYIVDKETQWPRIPDSPRRAGVSSFGFGGANAHVILEESPKQASARTAFNNDTYLFALSAMTSTALLQKIVDLRTWLNAQIDVPALASLSYTLNAGREHFSQRYCVIAKTITALQEQLNTIQSIDDITHSLASNDMHLNRLGEDYLQGKAIDWQAIYGDYREKISLPTYPFAKDSYWITINNKGSSKLHALIDETISNTNAAIFSKQFKGHEFYLKEHHVNNKSVLPGAIGLEMVQAAASILSPHHAMKTLTHIRWKKVISNTDLLKPIRVVFPNACVDSFVMTDDNELTEYMSGNVHYSNNKKGLPAQQNISALKSDLTHVQTANEIYTYFKKVGLSYGPNFQVIQSLHYNDHHLIAELALSATSLTNKEEFILHPCLLDGILQTTQALLKNRSALYLPYGIEQLTIYEALPQRCYVHAHLLSEKEELPLFNIQVMTNDGRVLLTINGFALGQVAQQPLQSDITTRYYHATWTEQPITLPQSRRAKSMLILGHDEFQVQSLKEQFKYEVLDTQIIKDGHLPILTQESIPPFILVALNKAANDNLVTAEAIQQELEKTYYLIHGIVSNVIKLKPQHKVQIVAICPDQSLLSKALAGFAKSVEQEQFNTSCRVVELYDLRVLENELDQHDIYVKYDEKNCRYVRQYLPQRNTFTQAPHTVLKKSGVYLITGGMGGLGYLLATYLADNYQAQLILIGRSRLSEYQRQLISDLETKGASVAYIQADVSQYEDVVALIHQAKQQFGEINGIIHTAGVTHDGLIVNKTLDEIAQVLAPKIHGSYYLDAATRDESLDFFVLFSSVAAIFGNLGQSDYAYANSFLDEFAIRREQQRLEGQCFGITRSINWPLWQEGGLEIAPEYQQILEQSLGLVSLPTQDGLSAFLYALEQNNPSCIVLPGHQPKLIQALQNKSLINTPELRQTKDSNQDLFKNTELFLKALLAKTLKCSMDSIESQSAFEHYGIDSIMIIQLNLDLATQFKDLPKTLFYEFQTLSALTQYFVDYHFHELKQILSIATLDKSIDVKPLTILPVQARFTAQSQDLKTQDIAIIGVSGRYPEAQDISEFWDNLKSGKDCITEVPKDRWNWHEYFDPNKDALGKTYSKWGGFLADIDKFDPLFFNISPREAVLIDPQERLFLETAWKTIEDAGYAKEQIAGKKVGVYVGVMYGQYQLFANDAVQSQFTPTNSVFASIANRVSYFFDFHGPSIALDTMCSSSLTAIHLACKSLQDGECRLALAGGVNLSVHPNKYLLLSHGKFLASDGHCRSFGDGGDGYVPGEAVGAVLLKPLHAAIADGDHIYAVIKGSQLNHGGKTNGYTVPNPNAQAELIAQTYQRANIPLSMVSYLEAHGTGTSLGDPIEIAGLNKAFNQESSTRYCAIGSVKSNIGHCESAAGIASVTKVLLQLQHKMLAPSIFSETLNSNINWEKTSFKVQKTYGEWVSSDQSPRVAGISSFGAGGSNAHLILAEAPTIQDNQTPTKSCYLLTISGKTEHALKERAADLWQWLDKNASTNLEQVSYTLNAGRSHFDWRCAMVVSSLDEAKQLLQRIDTPQPSAHLFKQVHEGKPSNADLAQLQKILDSLSHTSNYQECLLELAQLYVQGAELDWQRLHFNESKVKISLPSYPFAKERYWYSDIEPETCLETPIDTPIQKEDLNDKVLPSLLKTAGHILKITQHQIKAEKSLGDYGMDSIHFIELAKKIAEQYQIEFTPEVFYTHNSVLAISQYLTSHFPEAIARVHQTVIDRPSPVASIPSVRPRAIEQDTTEAIAIIGMQGLLPQSDDLAAFWQHLMDGNDLVTEVPPERWHWADYHGDIKKQADKSVSKWGAFINHVDQFDAGFFNISSREANLMDPQQRLFLEVVWKTIEDAGYNPFELSSYKVGVFAGVEFNEYHTLIAKHQKEFHGFIATGNSHSMLANRISYFFNFQGPSEAVDTACSSSMVALHRAVQAIRVGECNLAIAGGVSLILNPDTYVITSQLGALSADGRCKTFDASANGYVKGEGIGAFLLKPLKQAQLDGDSIYAVIKASAVNHGGKAQSLTAPNTSAQSDLLVNAYTQAGIEPDTITYIETHGTGTSLGDPVEIEGLKSAFNVLAPGFKNNTIGLGSVKTSIGHLEPASGMAGVMKIVLSMVNEKIPGILHFKQLNPYINLKDTPFYIAEKTQAWQRLKNGAGHDIPLRAGVSSFGFGGTNAHVVLEEGRLHQAVSNQQSIKPYYLIALSAKQPESLQQKIRDLYQWLTLDNESISLASLSFTLSQGRAHFLHRCALVVSSVNELHHSLQALSQDEMPDYCIKNEGQTCSMQGPVFDEVYQSALKALQNAEESNQYRHKLFILADLYTKHYPIEWQQLFVGEATQRISSLPGYPFIKQRYWYDLELNPEPAQKIAATASTTSVNTDLSTLALSYLRQIFSDKLQTSAQNIQVDATYEAYGVDSLITLDITNRLEKDFGTLPKTLLYERNTLNDLAHYFLKSHSATLATLLSMEQSVPPVTSVMTPDVSPTITPATKPLHVLGNPSESCDIAIIGLNGTFPMANSMDEFWHNLTMGRDCVGEVPSERWNYKDYPIHVGAKEKYFPHGGFIPDVDKFDPLFFNISPRDAGLMDPQERLFMQCAWSTLEDAGYTREKLKRNAKNAVGVFAGVTYNFYPVFVAEEWQKGNRVPLDVQTFSVANRLSYFLDINGPSFVVDTACSSSLAAIHLACDSLIRGDCAMAIAGGVNLSLHPSKYHFLGSFNFMSDQGRCASFAEGGSGYVPSEGVGTVLLKPLMDAIRDNDLIYGVIKGSSMNHGGKTSGYTVPNPNAQADVILQALNKAQVDPRTISYVEAHGTGTALGDPIEIRGLQQAYEAFTQDKEYCAIGSVKSNIGHLESAAGVSQLAKVLLQMRHKQLVPTLHTEQLNSFIDFKNSPFYVQRELVDWQPQNNMKRRAGISSFGAGGTNVHMIIEEYVPPNQSNNTVTGPYVFLLSALNAERLHAQVQQMQMYFKANNQPKNKTWLQDVCYTLQVGRESMPARLAILADTEEQLLETLAKYPNANRHNMWINTHAQKNMAAVVDTAILLGEKNLVALAQQWTQGTVIDWEHLYLQQTPRIVSLPTYSFAKRRCWIPTAEAEQSYISPPDVPRLVSRLQESQSIQRSLNPADKPQDIGSTHNLLAGSISPAVCNPAMENNQEFNSQEWLYKTQWEKNPPKFSSDQRLNDGRWLIFSDHELGLVLQQDIEPSSCIYCFSGDQFKKFNDTTYYINPTQKDSYALLFSDIHAEHCEHLKGIIYLTSSNTSNVLSHDPSLSLLYLFKTLIQHSWQHQLTFGLVTQLAQQVNSKESIDIWQHHLWSMTRIFAAEQANYDVVLLDLDSNERLRYNAHIIAQELKHQQSNQNHIAYRANERYTIRFAPHTPPVDLQPWKTPHSVLITGGLGALGYEVAEFLVSQGVRFVLLTGATELSSETKEKNTWLNQLVNTGIQVKYVSVDVADKDKMRRVIDETEAAWNYKIEGVFHLAGVTTDNVPIATMEEQLWREVLDVKIKGALVLHELFLHAELSCFVLFSSIAAVPHFGMAGLSAYAVANEFINGLALHRRSMQLPAQSINWVAWSEKGMSHRHNHDAFLEAVGMASLSIREGIALLKTILSLNPAEITVCKMEWKKFFQTNAATKHIDFFNHFVAENTSRSPVLISSLNKAEISTLVLNLFARLLVLEVTEIDNETPFQQYGMDSIIGIHFTGELGLHFPDVVSPMDLYRYPTLQQLTDYIIQQVQLSGEKINGTTINLDKIIDIEQLSAEQLNALLESELQELELAYD